MPGLIIPEGRTGLASHIFFGVLADSPVTGEFPHVGDIENRTPHPLLLISVGSLDLP